MRVVGIIPARWGSTRFEGKVLAEIAGKPMIQHVWERAKKSTKLDDVIIACDDERIISAAQQFGAKAVMTNDRHISGTDRIAEVAWDTDTDIVVNIQGDEPLIDPGLIDDLAAVFEEDKDCVMATAIKPLKDSNRIQSSDTVKVVIDENGYALYFSRSPIPYNDHKTDVPYYKHLGIYAYKKDFLLQIKDLPISDLEEAESLEQLRILEAGFKIKTIMTDVEMIGVDRQTDIFMVEDALKGKLWQRSL